MRKQSRADRRVHETRTRLHGALESLVHEKPYDEIVVKEIIARADIGRSTFYAHYRDKDELLDRGIRDLLRLDARPSERWTCATERLLRFSLPFLEHIERSHGDGPLSIDPGHAVALHQHLGKSGLQLRLQAPEALGPREGHAEHLGQSLAQGTLVHVAEVQEMGDQPASEEPLRAPGLHELAARDAALGEQDLGDAFPDHTGSCL